MIKFAAMEEGKIYDAQVLVMAVAERLTKAGEPFCVFTLSDGTEQVSANRFKDRAKNVPATFANNEIFIKKVCNARLECSSYNGNRSFSIKELTVAQDGSYQMDDFIMRAPLDSETMYNSIISGLEKQCKSNIKDIAINIFKQNKEKLLQWSAASSMHHAYYGGLLYHTFRMLNHAVLMGRVYKNLNMDILLVGVALHDIGKLCELETDPLGISEYTVDGNLLGHLICGIEMVTEEAARYPAKYNAEEVRMIKHLIASHHGRTEFGAIKPPATAEAFALWLIDMTDARMEGCEEAYADMKPGQMSQIPVKGLDARLYVPILA